MVVVLANQVGLYRGFTMLAKPAVLELHDDDRLTLTTIDRTTKAEIETVIDVPLSELSVRGESSQLALFAEGKKTKVDFSKGSGVAFLAGGAIGLAVAETLAMPNIGSWVDALKKRNVRVKYRKSSLPGLLIALFGLILAIMVVAVILSIVRGF